MPGLVIGEMKPDIEGIRLAVYYIVIMTIWLFQITLMGHLFAILWNGQIGTTIAIAAKTLSVMALSLIHESNFTPLEIAKLRLNLSAHLVMEWHGIDNMDSPYLRKLDVVLNYKESFLYVIAAAFVWVFVAAFVINRIDIIQNNKEI